MTAQLKTDALAAFQPATRDWFGACFGAPTEVQAQGWAAIATGAHALIAAPTGAGKTLAAFLAATDQLAAQAAHAPLPQATRILYVSPLKALSNDVARNLDAPLTGIAAAAAARGVTLALSTAVRTGDTPPAARARMLRRPPHILVTTPEGLYALLTSKGGRAMLATVETAIVDEIHALAPDRRGAHLALSLERLDRLTGRPVQRIGLSATQKPIATVAQFLTGGRPSQIVDVGHAAVRDLRIETPDAPLGAVLPNEVMDTVYDRVATLARGHATTIVFVNARRQCERVAHQLAQRLGADRVAAHHGSLAPPLRLEAERRLKAGELSALVATASLELGLDIGDVDLVVQLGSVKRIATFLQRVGRSNHRAGGVPKGVLMPLSRDELAEAVALMRRVEAGDLDTIAVPDHPLDVLAQQIVAAVAAEPVAADALFAMARGAWPYRGLARTDFEALLGMLVEGFPTERGRRGQLVHWDRAGGLVSARRGAAMTALTNGGSIPDSGDYAVRLEPQGVTVGAVAEDFAIHQVPGHVIQLGTNTWRVRQVTAGEVRVEPAPGEAPYMPVWFGEQPARSAELSAELSALKAEVAAASSAEAASAALRAPWLEAAAAGQLVAYLRAAHEALGVMPTAAHVVAERFSDLAGDTQLVLHSPHGARINRAWALALRRALGERLGALPQAAAIDDAILLSLPGQVSMPLGDILALVQADGAADAVAAAVLEVPMLMVRWRWAAARALAVPRQRGSRRVPPHIQRTDAEELLRAAWPDAPTAGLIRQEGREGSRKRAAAPGRLPPLPTHPLVRQALSDCLHEAMDVEGLTALLAAIEAGAVTLSFAERLTPSPAALQVVAAKPPAFLDDGAMMDRRARNVATGPAHLELEATTQVHPDALARVAEELAPDLRSAEDLATHLALAGVLTEDELGPAKRWLDELAAAGRARALTTAAGRTLWVAAERREVATAALAAGGPADPLATLLRGWLETAAPVTPDAVAERLGVPAPRARAALDRLVADGTALAGAFDPDRAGTTLWCDRRVLARIDRLTRNKLRAEIEPVSLQVFWRFLLRWQGLAPEDRRRGRDGLSRTLGQLDGLELPAGLWEGEVLAGRAEGYDLDDLDELCLSGRFGWGRLTQPSAEAKTRRAKLARTTPVALFDAENLELWRDLAGPPAAPVPLSGPGEAIVAALSDQGASFLPQLERAGRLMGAQVEDGLMELVAAGRITADSFAGLRALLAKPARPRVSRRDLISNSNSGRWAQLPPPQPLDDPVARAAAVERVARVLLARWGVVVRSVVAREATGVSWLELLRVLRRMEARGEVRGGYFVAGAGGEHYALPEAMALLRAVRAAEPKGELVSLSTADPLNLTGVLAPGRRVPARATVRLLLRDGVPVGVGDRDAAKPLTDAPLGPAEMAALRRSPAPAALRVYG